jgi:hypothetical protein
MATEAIPIPDVAVAYHLARSGLLSTAKTALVRA